MKRSEVNIIALTILLIMMLSACDLPIKVKRIDSVNAPASGIRYILKRPSYEVGLKLKDDAFKIKEPKADIGKLKTIQTIKKEADKCEINFEVVIKQNLDGEPLTYEVTTPNGFSAIPHILSDTEVIIKTEADATLQSITAGETDKSLEFVQAIAGIAKKAAGPMLAIEPPYCELIKTPEFQKYAENHLYMLQQQENNSTKIKTMLESISVENGAQVSDAIALLREEQNRLKEDLKNIQFELKKNEDYNLTIEGRPLSTVEEPSKPYFYIELNKK